jgi:hypothetical protein
MDDHEDSPNNIISRINEIYGKPNFILYAPPTAEINKKTLINPYYYKNIEKFFITNPGIFKVSDLIINQLKLKYTTFLLIDGENLLHRLIEYKGKQNITQADILDILQPYYTKNICIIIFCQQHNIQVGKPYYNIDQQKDNALIMLFKHKLPSQTEIDDIILMYFYIFININKKYQAKVLSFDKNSWFDPKSLSNTTLSEHKSIYINFLNEINTLSQNKKTTNLENAIIANANSINVMPLPKNPPTLIRKYSLKSKSSSSNSSRSSKSSRGRSRSRSRSSNSSKSNRSRSRNRSRKQKTIKRTKFTTYRTKRR